MLVAADHYQRAALSSKPISIRPKAFGASKQWFRFLKLVLGSTQIRYTSMNELYDIILRTNRAWKNVVVNVVALIIGQRTEVGPRSN